MLHDGGQLGEDELGLLDCPCNGHEPQALVRCPTSRPSAGSTRPTPTRACEAIGSDYAYNVGYHHPDLGRVVPIAAVHSANIAAPGRPAPARRTSGPGSTGNSPNHGGRGQNVLYSDLHVGWHNTRRLGPNDDDMFLNALRQIGPGLNADDAALLPSMMPVPGHAWRLPGF